MRARCGPSGWTPGTGWFNRRAKKRGGMRVLVVEDEATLRDSLQERLAAAGFTVDVARDGNEGLFAGLEYPLDVAIVDLGLPNLPGLEVIRRLRAARKTFPILILTARDNWQDKVEGLQAGADDYVAKPFHFEEVLARLQALLRRAGGWASPQLNCGAVVLDTRAQTVAVSGAPVELTTFEYRILEHLMLRAGDVISKTELTERLYDQDFDRDSNVIEGLVGRPSCNRTAAMPRPRTPSIHGWRPRARDSTRRSTRSVTCGARPRRRASPPAISERCSCPGSATSCTRPSVTTAWPSRAARSSSRITPVARARLPSALPSASAPMRSSCGASAAS